MKTETKELVFVGIVTILIVYYLLRLFTFLYMFNALNPIDDTYIKTRPAIEQGHLRAEQLRLLKHGKDNKK